MDYYKLIKDALIDVEIYKQVKDYRKNNYELEKYYQIGKLLIEAQGGEIRAKYGDGLIKEYSKKLINEIDKKYNITLLKRTRQFYLLIQKGATLSRQLSWSTYVEILKFNNINQFNYYVRITTMQNLSVRSLRSKIKSHEYERLDDDTKMKLITNEELSITDNLKHPIVIKNKYDANEISEKMLKRLILDDMENFLRELGNGYSFIASEYKINIGNNFNYIDLLLFNIEYNSYVVIELKVTELKKEHIGQIHTYINYIDNNLKKLHHDKTIGIIIVKKDNKFIMEYCTDTRIFRTTYSLI